MFIDTGLLRMGADFSSSASEIVKRGANDFASTSLPAGIFGDFDAAHEFDGALRRAHEAQVTAMRLHEASFNGIAEKANIGAGAFIKQDEAGEAALRATGIGLD